MIMAMARAAWEADPVNERWPYDRQQPYFRREGLRDMRAALAALEAAGWCGPSEHSEALSYAQGITEGLRQANEMLDEKIMALNLDRSL